MRVIWVRNVCQALPQGLALLDLQGKEEDSRAGRVLTAPCPVTTVYTHPEECVLTNPARDANPFFHLLEALWILAGRADAGFLNTYIKDFGSRFAEAEGDIHGAYGHRWRYHFGLDQLTVIIQKLRADPNTRQAVLQMWDPRPSGGDDLRGDWKDRPCNMQVVFRLRSGNLDMTVYNRSNDIIMGCYGANAVHFSFLQQYMAGHLGVSVGSYTQVSNDYHLYLNDYLKMQKRSAGQGFYTAYRGPPQPLVTHPQVFDTELLRFFRVVEFKAFDETPRMQNTFLTYTALPVAAAHALYREGNMPDALAIASTIQAADWKRACVEWLQRRVK